MNRVIIHNAQEIVTPRGSGAKFGKNMQDLQRIEQGSIVIQEGIIQAVDTARNIEKQFDLSRYECLDASGKSVIPGFVDAHTHFIFGGYRQDEFIARIEGRSYMEIMQKGGGIWCTVAATRHSSADELYQLGLERLNHMLAFGVTTLEGKSGYGLDIDTEVKQLNVMRKLRQNHPLDIVSTFMGAHAVPGEMAGQEERYIDFIMEKVLPHVVAEDLAEFCDVFCEQGVFSVDSSRRLLVKAKEMGLKAKLHADEICPFGGAELSGEIEAVSADHLLYASPAGIKAMADNRVIATLLPSTAFCLGEPFADARGMIDQGCAVALASDYNPGSCFTHSLPLVLALACIKMKMTVEEAITAVTLNGAAAVDRAASIGSIEPGKQADILLLQYPSCKFLIYNTGMNIVDKVIKKGRVVYQANKQ